MFDDESGYLEPLFIVGEPRFMPTIFGSVGCQIYALDLFLPESTERGKGECLWKAQQTSILNAAASKLDRVM